MRRWKTENADLWIFLTLIAVAAALLHGHGINSQDAVATLVGSFFGAAALLLGNYINRRNERRKAREDLEDRVRKLKALIAAELVNVAAGLIDVLETMDAAIATAEANGILPDRIDLTGDSPRPMPFTDGLGSELLILEQIDIDVLTTLRSNLATTRMSMGKGDFGYIVAWQLAASIRHAMGVLSQAFVRFAPERKLQLGDRDPELASTILRRLANENYPNQSGDGIVTKELTMTLSKNRKRILVVLGISLCIIGLAITSHILYDVLSINNVDTKFSFDKAIRVQEVKQQEVKNDYKNIYIEDLLGTDPSGVLPRNWPPVKKFGLDLSASSDTKGDFLPTGYHWKRWGMATRTAAILIWHGEDNLGAWKIWRVSRCIDHYYAENSDSEPLLFVFNSCLDENK